MKLVHQASLELKNDLDLFIKNNINKLIIIPELDYMQKLEYWNKIYNIIKKYKFEIFFREIEMILRFCFVLSSSDTKYIPFFDEIRINNLAHELNLKFKIINLLEFEKTKFSLRLDQIRLDQLYYNDIV